MQPESQLARPNARAISPANTACRLLTFAACLLSALCFAEAPKFVDCSLLVAPDYPATWPSNPFPRFQIMHQRTIGPDSPYNIDALLIDGNTGTQLDVPPHSVARPDLQRPKSGPLGLAYTDKIEAWQFGGEACVIDVRNLLDKAAKGVSPLIGENCDHRRAAVEDSERTGTRISNSEGPPAMIPRLCGWFSFDLCFVSSSFRLP